ncbi:16S rRNA (cytidine(1402)-2'-O)-methyltransferase [Fructilactobacillus myrtifloralis]|uniref:Ribosomal RNA small subunit methyltransferase I n=1 Tax=Fructilactobacillus myrtifloralis TaxID=2940301 RepID=A0ABY5BPQ7_9LACO|nr:16S rRNA (cytidine(1402)-2'-O)-methyltransferase [Fructilactobacillus myrtifloralis]USS84936.1 16S rRNA (cytidine(1402)-2'-O)-methyltransferase [Fructilactobacillus myrtifloralis]
MTIYAQSSFAARATGTLYLVPTPIGNLDDITLRALNTLRTVDVIAAEDTRNTQKLLNHFEIGTKQISFHEHNTARRIPELIDRLEAGEAIAQVSDAGMPSVSDPGHELVQACIEHQLPVVSLPGSTAGLTSLIASGLSPQPFLFYGFLQRKPAEQRRELQRLQNETATLIFYEAPHRLKKTLTNLAEVLGDRPAALGRELTKKHEEYVRGTLSELVKWATEEPVRGEFVILVAGNPEPTSTAPVVAPTLPIEAQVQQLVQTGMKPNQAIKQVAKTNHLVRQDVYNRFHQLDK